MSIKAPPIPLPTPNYDKMVKGTIVHRVHQTTFAGDAFNPCFGGQTRFAPILDSSGLCVPSLYAGETVISTIYETIFHDVSATTSFKTVPMTSVESRSHSELEVRRDIKIVRLHAPDLKKWGISKSVLIGASAKLYGDTAKWAETIHHSYPDAEGLKWTSNQCDPDEAYLFFGDRVAAADFNIVATRDAKSDASFKADVLSAGKLAGISIVV